MNLRSLLFLLLLVLTFVQLTNAQTEQTIRRAAQGKVGANSNELVSFKEDVPYTKAIQSLGELSKKFDGKLILDRSPLQGKDKSIGVNIQSMYWKDALELILRSNQLWYNDYPEYLEIVSFDAVGKQSVEQAPSGTSPKGSASNGTTSALPEVLLPGTARTSVVADSGEYYSRIKEVNIAGIFFDINRTKMAQSGIDFHISRGSNMNLTVDILGRTQNITSGGSVTTAPRTTDQFLNVGASPTSNQLGVNMSAALSMFETDQLGEVVARPQIIVRSGTSSRIQIGQDFSVLEKDFSGNTIQRFYPTGTILEIKPKVYKVGDVEFVDLHYNIEKSTFESSSSTTIINKNVVSGSLILLNGEEGYVGGLYSTDETTIREGVPILKDLPWWVLGLRYIFGYNSSSQIKRELIVLLKADIMPTLEERAAKQPEIRNIIKDTQQEMEKNYEQRTGKKF